MSYVSGGSLQGLYRHVNQACTATAALVDSYLYTIAFLKHKGPSTFTVAAMLDVLLVTIYNTAIRQHGAMPSKDDLAQYETHHGQWHVTCLCSALLLTALLELVSLSITIHQTCWLAKGCRSSLSPISFDNIAVPDVMTVLCLA